MFLCFLLPTFPAILSSWRVLMDVSVVLQNIYLVLEDVKYKFPGKWTKFEWWEMGMNKVTRTFPPSAEFVHKWDCEVKFLMIRFGVFIWSLAWNSRERFKCYGNGSKGESFHMKLKRIVEVSLHLHAKYLLFLRRTFIYLVRSISKVSFYDVYDILFKPKWSFFNVQFLKLLIVSIISSNILSLNSTCDLTSGRPQFMSVNLFCELNYEIVSFHNFI